MVARKPSGFLGRLLYRYPIGHKPGFDLVLEKKPPASTDKIVELGCGGGVFMSRALASGCNAVGIDYSSDMVYSTSTLNADAVKDGRLEVIEADVTKLPLEDASVDKVYTLNAFFFFPKPETTLSEIARVLKPGGWVVISSAAPGMKDSVEKFSVSMAEAMRFDNPDTVTEWGDAVGLTTTDVEFIGNEFVWFAQKDGAAKGMETAKATEATEDTEATEVEAEATEARTEATEAAKS